MKVYWGELTQRKATSPSSLATVAHVAELLRACSFHLLHGLPVLRRPRQAVACGTIEACRLPSRGWLYTSEGQFEDQERDGENKFKPNP